MKKLYIICLLFLAACSSSKKPDSALVSISLVNNKQSVQFKGLDYAVISEINRDSSVQAWQSLIPVYKMPADTDMKSYQPVQPGRYQLQDSAVVFTPDTPFAKGQVYFVRNYKLGESVSAVDFVKGRIQPGRTRFTDLIFKQ
ncbi:hypothetical protein FFF34_013225 [Inquilinus sp. KBS0705]|nr:hypothetical protein FFF34_013225 [Inquilinus sp. KBS0705]